MLQCDCWASEWAICRRCGRAICSPGFSRNRGSTPPSTGSAAASEAHCSPAPACCRGPRAAAAGRRRSLRFPPRLRLVYPGGAMYTSFFGPSEKPFAITPDPRYLYLSERHAEALAHLLYGINQSGGFIQLTGEVGTGKTTVVRTLLAQTPKNAEIALILNPRMTAPEFLLTICEELGIGVPDAATES